jgi:hypothetical protein
MNPEFRPSAREIEDSFSKFDVCFWDSLPMKRDVYEKVSIEYKDQIFLSLWD